MTHRSSAFVALITALAVARPAVAGAPISQERRAGLPGICESGDHHGEACHTNADCGGVRGDVASHGRCRIALLPGKPPPLRITLIVDDDVSAFDGSETLANVVAVTAVVEARRGHERRILAQTYQNLDDSSLEALVAGLTSGVAVADLASRDRVLTEAALNAAVADGGILDDFLFQGGDSELADALRELYGVDGRPVIVKVAASPDTLVNTDEEATGRASAVQLLASIRFVPEG